MCVTNVIHADKNEGRETVLVKQGYNLGPNCLHGMMYAVLWGGGGGLCPGCKIQRGGGGGIKCISSGSALFAKVPI